MESRGSAPKALLPKSGPNAADPLATTECVVLVIGAEVTSMMRLALRCTFSIGDRVGSLSAKD